MSRKQEIFQAVLTSPYNNDNFVSFVREFLNNVEMVAPNRYVEVRSNFSFYVNGYYHIGNYISDDGDKIAVISVCLNRGDTVERARGMQRNFVKPLIESGGCAGALVAFYTKDEPDKWRLSFIRMDYEFSKGKVTEKLTPAKRYSYLVGKGEPCHTAQTRLYPIFLNDVTNPGIDELEEAFSVEKVTKEFFDLYCEKYHQLREYLESNKEFMMEAECRKFTSEQFAKKLLGQIVFLYFIQKKGWLGVEAIPVTLTEKAYKNAFFAKGTKSREIMPKVYKEQPDGTYRIIFEELQKLSDDDEEILASIVKGKPWGSGPKDFMRKIFEGCKSAGKNYFDDYLEPLFYTGLNKNRGENGFYAPLHRRIPFLNGGLFEQLDNYEWEYNNFAIPNELFSNADTKGRDADGILDIFDRYNFTMNEDEPMEREVAIDPEMLGKVFENLLDVSDRKSKGAFYTPREIVHYMCQETLINYLVTKSGLPETDIRDFILYGDLMKDEDTTKASREGNRDMLISSNIFDLQTGVNRLKELDDLLATVRVADLAVGSGAFPLGMLNEIVKARETLSAYMAIGMNAFQKKSFYAYDRKPYDLKVNTIKNCIYACDIEPSAVDIAKLRLWLSIVIDDEIAAEAGNGEFDAHTKPRQLPNLDCNIICGNSLIDEFKGNKLISESELLHNVSENSQMTIYQGGVDSLISELIKLQDKLFFVKEHDEKEEIKQKIQDIYNQIILEQLHGNPELIEEYYEAIKESSKPFILWQLYFPHVFRDNGGFDIIIGNPPYIRERDNKKVFEPVNNTEFGKLYHQGKMDYWYYFLHRAISYTNANGCISFITPRYWLNGAGATNLIKRIHDELSFEIMVDIGNLKVFDNVVGYHMIAQYSKQKSDEFTYKKLENNLQDIGKDYETENLEIKTLHNSKVITSSWEIILEQDKSFEGCVLLGDISEASQGVVEASDRVSKRLYDKCPREDVYIGKGIFVLSQDEVDELGLSDEEKELLVPYIDGNDISRYQIVEPRNWLIYSDADARAKIANDIRYSKIKNHLDNMAEYITSSNAPYGLHRPRKRHFFDNTKILMPSMFGNNDFVIDYNNKYFVGMSFTCIEIISDEYLVEYVLAVLNSSVAKKWFYAYGKKRGVGVDIGVDKVRSFPIKPCPMEKQQEIALLVKTLIESDGLDETIDMQVDEFIQEIYGGE